MSTKVQILEQGDDLCFSNLQQFRLCQCSSRNISTLYVRNTKDFYFVENLIFEFSADRYMYVCMYVCMYMEEDKIHTRIHTRFLC